MFDALDAIHAIYRGLHIGLGFVGLFLFWVPVCARKGSRLHRTSGYTFAAIAYFVAGTAVISCVWGLVSPWTFIGRPSLSVETQQDIQAFAGVRFFVSVLLLLSLSVVSALTLALTAVRTRDEHRRMRSPLVIGSQVATLVASIGVFAYGAWHIYWGYRGAPSPDAGGVARYWILVGLGAFIALDARKELRYVMGPPPPRGTWMIKHLESMLGVGIAFYTAFAVFGSRRFVPLELSGAWALLPWILPAAVGLPLIELTKHRWRRRLGLSNQTTN